MITAVTVRGATATADKNKTHDFTIIAEKGYTALSVYNFQDNVADGFSPKECKESSLSS
jgi:hypothetical protein